MRHQGRKHRALERIKALRNIEEQHARKRAEKQIRRSSVKLPSPSVNRIPMEDVREAIGFVVPKAGFRESHRYGGFFGNWQDVKSPALGICACGCGGRTTRYTKNCGVGRMPGNFAKFISGHQWFVRRRMLPPTYKSQYEILQERDHVRSELAKKVAESKARTFLNLRRHYQPVINGRSMNNQGISRMLNLQLGFCPLVTRKIVKVAPAPITTRYPFISTQATTDHDLILEILKVIGDRVGGHAIGDLAQDIALAILSGKETLDSVRRNIQPFINNWWKRFGFFGHNIVSLDAPIGREADAGSLYDLVDGQKALTELQGGVNYDTQSHRFVFSGQWDGEICARY